MNHLAHSLLSYPDGENLLGNFIGDFVKGSAWQAYPPEIRAGILLHRRIDAFTDNHPAVRASVRRIRPVAGRYAGPVADVLYDHLLLRHWSEYAELSFDDYAVWLYSALDERQAWMPELLQQRWPLMREARFVHGYADEAGMLRVLERFSRRLAGHFDPAAVHAAFFGEMEAFSADFSAFFPALLEHLAANPHRSDSFPNDPAADQSGRV
jgi:acyl carrier protein phosphodiesterase